MMKKFAKVSKKESRVDESSFSEMINGPIGRSSPAPSSTSSIVSENYPPDSMRMYGGQDNGRQDSLSPSGSVTSIHDAYYLNDRIRCLETEKLALMIDHNNLIREFNKRMESHLEEIRNLKEANQNIEQESAELRDLSCFLDDDRQKCRKLAKEWQRFGKHTVAVMRTEVMSYQEKLRSLEIKQTELIKENGELRDLCVYLDNQRTGTVSSEGESNTMNYSICKNCSALRKSFDSNGDVSTNHDYPAEHVTRLQNQIMQLEREKDTLHKLLMYGGKSRKDKKRVSFSVPTDDDYDSSSTTSEVDRLDFPPSFGSTESVSKNYDNVFKNGLLPPTSTAYSDISPRNNDVSRVDDNITESQINDIRLKLNRSRLDGDEANLSEHEITLLKDMCNVVTRKLRSDSNNSSSMNNSFELTSPISPPPTAFGLPLYNQRRSSNEQRRGSNEQRRGSNDIELSSISERQEYDDEAKTSTRALPSYEEVAKPLEQETDDIDEIMKGINSTLADSILQLDEKT